MDEPTQRPPWIPPHPAPVVADSAAIEELRRTRDRAAALETKNAALEQELAWLREQFTTAIANERYALRTMANLAMQKQYGVTPYPDAAAMPAGPAEDRLPETFTPARQGVDLVREANRLALEDYRRQYPNGDGPVSVEALENMQAWI